MTQSVNPSNIDLLFKWGNEKNMILNLVDVKY